MARNRWTDEMDKKLRELEAAGMLKEEIAQQFGITKGGVESRMSRIGLRYNTENPIRKEKINKINMENAKASAARRRKKRMSEREREIEFARENGIEVEGLSCKGCKNYKKITDGSAVSFCDYFTKHDHLRPCETYAYLIYGIEGVGRPLGCEMYEKRKINLKEEQKCKMSRELFPWRYTKR